MSAALWIFCKKVLGQTLRVDLVLIDLHRNHGLQERYTSAVLVSGVIVTKSWRLASRWHLWGA